MADNPLERSFVAAAEAGQRQSSTLDEILAGQAGDGQTGGGSSTLDEIMGTAPDGAAPSPKPAAATAPVPGPGDDESWGHWFENLTQSAWQSLTAIPQEMGKASQAAQSELVKDLTDPAALKTKAEAVGPGVPGNIPVIAGDVVEYLKAPFKGAATAIVGRPVEAATGLPKEIAGEATSMIMDTLVPVMGEVRATAAVKAAASKLPPNTMRAVSEPGFFKTMPVIHRDELVRVLREAALKEENSRLTTELSDLPAVDQAAVDRLTRYETVERNLADPELSADDRKALMQRRDELLADTTPEKLREDAAPAEQRRALENQKARIAEQFQAIETERAAAAAEQAGLEFAKGQAPEELIPGSGVRGIPPLAPKNMDAWISAQFAAAEDAAAGGAAKKAAPLVTMKTKEGPKPIKVDDELRRKAVAFAEGKGDESPVNLAIADPARTIADLSKIIPKGEVKPVAVSKANAYATQMSADEVMARIRPIFPSDEAFAAAQIAVNSTAETVQQLARRWGETGAKEDGEAFTRAYALLNQYLGDLRKGATDLGRGMRIRQEMVESTPERLAEIQKMVSEAAGGDLETVAKKIAALKDPKKVPAWMSNLRSMSRRQAFVYAYQNLLLSNPLSVAKELSSDPIVAGWDVVARGLAEAAGGARRGSAATLGYGYTSSFIDALRMAARALKEGESQFAPEFQTIEGNVTKSKSRFGELAKAMAKPGEAEEAPSAAIRFLNMAIPTNWQLAADDFHKYFHYNAYRRLYAYERAAEGGGDAAAIGKRMQELLDVTPQDIHEAALGNALKNSFQEPLTPFWQTVATGVDKANVLGVPVGRLIMPFTKVPINIARWGVENSPMGILSARVRADIAAGGTRRSLALARMGMGAGVMGGVGALWAQDLLTGYGPHDPSARKAWQDAGFRPYSVKGPDGHWYGYQGTPLATIIGPMADSLDVYRFMHDGSTDDQEDVLWSGIFGIGQAMLAPTYLQGVGNFFDALMDPESHSRYFGENLVASAVPQAVWGIERATDPIRRAHYDWLDTVRARTPGLASDLPPVVDTWGNEVKWPRGVLWPISGSPVADAISPFRYQPGADGEPIAKWIWDNRLAFPHGGEGQLGLGSPGLLQTFSSGPVSTRVKLTPQQAYRLKMLAANEVKDPATKLGAKDLFNALVENRATGTAKARGYQRQWNEASPELKAKMIQDIWTVYREAAKQTLRAEEPGLDAKINEGLGQRGEALMRGPGQAPATARPQIQ